jgi:rod shape-determining protein MreC
MGHKRSGAASGLAALLILCVTSLTLFTIYVKEGSDGPLHTIQLGAAEVLQPMRSGVSTVASPLDSVRGRVEGAFKDDKTDELRLERRESDAAVAELSRLRRENERLREMVDGSRSTYEYGPLARVVAPVGDQFSERIRLNVGTREGIKPEMPVVVGDNLLVGRTMSVTENTSEVLLVTDPEFKAGVRIVPPDAIDPDTGELTVQETEKGVPFGQGLLGTTWESYLGIELVNLGDRAEKDDFVVTSGRAGDKELLYPPGLLVGKVESSTATDIDQFKKIVVTPAVKPEELEEVRVIVGW